MSHHHHGGRRRRRGRARRRVGRQPERGQDDAVQRPHGAARQDWQLPGRDGGPLRGDAKATPWRAPSSSRTSPAPTPRPPSAPTRRSSPRCSTRPTSWRASWWSSTPRTSSAAGAGRPGAAGGPADGGCADLRRRAPCRALRRSRGPQPIPGPEGPPVVAGERRGVEALQAFCRPRLLAGPRLVASPTEIEDVAGWKAGSVLDIRALRRAEPGLHHLAARRRPLHPLWGTLVFFATSSCSSRSSSWCHAPRRRRSRRSRAAWRDRPAHIPGSAWRQLGVDALLGAGRRRAQAPPGRSACSVDLLAEAARSCAPRT